MKEYTLSKNSGPASQTALLDELMKISVAFQLVQRDGQDISSEMPANLRALLIHTHRVMQWPGTQIYSGEGAIAYIFRSRASLIPGFFILPNGLEDISFYRNDNTVICGSITHEGDAWLHLTDDEYENLSSAAANCLTLMGKLPQ